jgi:hypothetical protein
MGNHLETPLGGEVVIFVVAWVTFFFGFILGVNLNDRNWTARVQSWWKTGQITRGPNYREHEYWEEGL